VARSSSPPAALHDRNGAPEFIEGDVYHNVITGSRYRRRRYFTLWRTACCDAPVSRRGSMFQTLGEPSALHAVAEGGAKVFGVVSAGPTVSIRCRCWPAVESARVGEKEIRKCH